MLDKAELVRAMDGPGYLIVKDVLPPDFVARCRADLERAIELETKYHNKGTDHREYAMVLICSLYGRSFIEVFDIPIVCEGLNAILGEGCITYAYTSSSMPPGRGNYSLRIHVDQPRIIPGYRTNMGAIFLLDDFTEENGATWLLPASQNRLDEPSKEEFYRDSVRAIAPAGSILFIDPRLWHAGGENKTDKWRHAITLNMCRPWMKQRLDIPRAMSCLDLTSVSETALQKLGFRAQMPASYEDFYAPPEQRKFRQKTE
jgi:ectoine hydroxylase-related dioxygenase (phytanoyl-CoA dioxygenase family)